MVAQAVCRLGVAALVLTLAVGAAHADDGTTFLGGPELALRLLPNLVRIEARDINEQGFGLVVGGDAEALYVLTAQHVVASRPPAGLEGPVRPSRQIEIDFCALPQAAPASAQAVEAFTADGADIALLRVARPAGYTPQSRALAPEPKIRPGGASWVIGFEQRCEMLASAGAVESARDERDNLRIRQPGVRGGSSGGPLLVGEGLAGLVTDSDTIMVTAYSLAPLQQRLRALGLPWWLEDARNIPPTDPAAARIDLAETLNRYLFAVRNAHGLLLQPKVARATYADYVASYNRALGRFRDARDKYDAALAQHWPPAVLPAWQRLREELWAVHLRFWETNADARTIYESQAVPPAVVARMKDLEPALQALQGDIAQFLRALGPPKEQTP